MHVMKNIHSLLTKSGNMPIERGSTDEHGITAAVSYIVQIDTYL
jgi:hypothetical protein